MNRRLNTKYLFCGHLSGLGQNRCNWRSRGLWNWAIYELWPVGERHGRNAVFGKLDFGETDWSRQSKMWWFGSKWHDNVELFAWQLGWLEYQQLCWCTTLLSFHHQHAWLWHWWWERLYDALALLGDVWLRRSWWWIHLRPRRGKLETVLLWEKDTWWAFFWHRPMVYSYWFLYLTYHEISWHSKKTSSYY